MISQSQVKPEECRVFLCTIRVGRILKLAAIACLLAISGIISQAQTDFEAIVRNIEPIGEVCLAGQNCAGGTATNAINTNSAATSTVAAAITQSAPAATPAAAPAFDAAATYQLSCFACHASGAAGAPELGDVGAWEERMAKGIDTVLANAINGIGAMPAKGMCMTCSDDDIRSLVDYMVEESQ